MNQRFSLLAVFGAILLLGSLAAPAWANNSNRDNARLGRLIADSNSRDSIRDQMERGSVDTAAALAAFKAAREADKLTTLKKFGDTAVTNRLNALAKLREKVDSGFCSTINEAVKTLILSDITAIENNLKTQQAKIDDNTQLENGKSQVKNLFSANRVFAHFIPAVRGICVSEKIIELVDNKITPAIAELTTAGKDTAQITTDAAAAKTAASDALALYEKVAAAPGNTAENRTSLQTANTNLAKARASLAAVKADFEKLKN